MDWMKVVIGFVLMGGVLFGWYRVMRHLKGEGGSGMKLDLPKGKARRRESVNELEAFVAAQRAGGVGGAAPAGVEAAPAAPAMQPASPVPATAPTPGPSTPASVAGSAPLLSGPAKLAFLVFRAALPDHLVFARVPLGEIVADAGIARGHVFTLVVCRTDLTVVGLADLATPEGPPPAVSATLARAGVHHVVIDPARLPRRDAIRTLLAID
jgi:hypothetical protein